MSLKCEPELAEQLRGSYPDDVVPGYHLNKRHWNTVMCSGAVVSDEMVRDMVEDSYDLIVAAMPRRCGSGWAGTVDRVSRRPSHEVEANSSWSARRSTRSTGATSTRCAS